MKKEKKEALFEQIYEYLNRKYNVSREEVMVAVARFGLVKGQLDTFFMVQAHQKKKVGQGNGLPPSGKA